MSNFAHAIESVMLHEGGYVDNPSDPGGATNYGISLRWLKSQGDLDGDGWLEGDLDHDGDVDVDDIKMMDKEQAMGMYRTLWWEPYRYDLITSQPIANKVFDLTVNMGSKQSHKLLQRAIRACGLLIKDDGIIGNKTLESINVVDELSLIPAYRSEAAGFYRGLAIKNPKFNTFLKGWLNRAYS